MWRKTYRNAIYSITKDHGEILHDPESVEKCFIDYYRGLLGQREVRTGVVKRNVVELGNAVTLDQKLPACEAIYTI